MRVCIKIVFMTRLGKYFTTTGLPYWCSKEIPRVNKKKIICMLRIKLVNLLLYAIQKSFFIQTRTWHRLISSTFNLKLIRNRDKVADKSYNVKKQNNLVIYYLYNTNLLGFLKIIIKLKRFRAFLYTRIIDMYDIIINKDVRQWNSFFFKNKFILQILQISSKKIGIIPKFPNARSISVIVENSLSAIELRELERKNYYKKLISQAMHTHFLTDEKIRQIFFDEIYMQKIMNRSFINNVVLNNLHYSSLKLEKIKRNAIHTNNNFFIHFPHFINLQKKKSSAKAIIKIRDTINHFSFLDAFFSAVSPNIRNIKKPQGNAMHHAFHSDKKSSFNSSKLPEIAGISSQLLQSNVELFKILNHEDYAVLIKGHIIKNTNINKAPRIKSTYNYIDIIKTNKVYNPLTLHHDTYNCIQTIQDGINLLKNWSMLRLTQQLRNIIFIFIINYAKNNPRSTFYFKKKLLKNYIEIKPANYLIQHSQQIYYKYLNTTSAYLSSMHNTLPTLNIAGGHYYNISVFHKQHIDKWKMSSRFKSNTQNILYYHKFPGPFGNFLIVISFLQRVYTGFSQKSIYYIPFNPKILKKRIFFSFGEWQKTIESKDWTTQQQAQIIKNIKKNQTHTSFFFENSFFRNISQVNYKPLLPHSLTANIKKRNYHAQSVL
jgi:hypothetical protein